MKDAQSDFDLEQMVHFVGVFKFQKEFFPLEPGFPEGILSNHPCGPSVCVSVFK